MLINPKDTKTVAIENRNTPETIQKVKLKDKIKRLFLEEYEKNTNFLYRFHERMILVDPLIGMNWVLIYLNVFLKNYQKHLKNLKGDITGIINERVKKAIDKLDNLRFFKD